MASLLIAVICCTIGLAGAGLLWTARGIQIRHHRVGFRVAVLRAMGYLLLVAWIYAQAGILADSYYRFALSGYLSTPAAPLIVRELAGFAVIAGGVLLAGVFTIWSLANGRPERLLLWTLRQAVLSGSPLAAAFQSLSRDTSGRLRRRSRRLARLLEAGYSPDRALRAAWGRTTVDGDLAIALGIRMGNLQHTMSHLTPSDTSIPNVVDSIVRTIWYASGIIAASGIIVSAQVHFLVFIIDAIREAEPTVVDQSGELVLLWYIHFVVLPVMLVSVVPFGFITVFALLYHWGIIKGYSGLWDWFTRPLDAARIIDHMGTGMQSGWSELDYLTALAEVYPKRSWQYRLQKAQRAVAAGMSLPQALGQAKILSVKETRSLGGVRTQALLAARLRRLAIQLRQQFLTRLALVHHAVSITMVFMVAAVVGTMGVIIFRYLVIFAEVAESWSYS
ncbi:MAG: hypothetical protein KatS3mg110_4204 [Pirellulaceae bacterium]|nr:MAG: hypothetical protein KatS3mg110_4204 [Pirellulaceae bacterium]